MPESEVNKSSSHSTDDQNTRCDECAKHIAQVMIEEWLVTQHSFSIRAARETEEWRWVKCNDGDGDVVVTTHLCYECFEDAYDLKTVEQVAPGNRVDKRVRQARRPPRPRPDFGDMFEDLGT